MAAAARIAALVLGLAAWSGANAASFHLFPVQEIEGVSAQGRAARPLVDARVVDRLFGGEPGKQAQRAMIDHFVAQLGQAYPGSLIHPKQVYDTNIGSGYKFINDDNGQCRQAPSFNVADTYAVVIGVTRASLYEVVKGDNIEVLIPVTLSLQFVKPNLAKVVYTMSETAYSPFRFSKAEYASGAADAVIRAQLMKNVTAQVGSLVASARAAFNPKDVVVKLVGKDGKYFVADQGVEAGFVKGEQVEARDSAANAYIFDVLYADSGYAVVRPVAGSVSVGDSLKFVFETAADDSRKPRLMPVVNAGPGNEWASAVSDMFARDIGFNASFQLSPVDVHFTQTKQLVTRSANCVTWQKYPSMTQASGERKDPPDFFLRFTPVLTPLATLSGAGGTKTSERFHTLVTAQVVDQFGKVIYSEAGDNDYAIDKVNGAGLGFAEAKEVSLKNATGKLAQNFIAKVRFAPKDYKVVKVDQQRIWVEGLAGMPTSEKLSFTVLHPLDAMVRGKPALLELETGAGAADLLAEGELLGLPYSATNPSFPAPRRGDLVRLFAQAVPSVTRIVDCDEGPFIGQNNLVDAPYLAPLVRHALYQSKKFASHIGDPAFYATTNQLLGLGLFDLQVKRPEIEVCSQPGYVIREDAAACESADNCKATITMGLVTRLKKGSEVYKSISAGLKTDYSGFPSANKSSYYGYKQLGNGLSMQSDLINKLNQN